MNAARAARCSGEQGKFWEMRWALMRNANLLSPAFIGKTAADLKLDTQVFSACASSSKFDEAIEADVVEAAGLGLTGTPTFIVGRTTPGVLEGSVVVGALPYPRFDAKLKELLGGSTR